MAELKSNLTAKRTRHRGLYAGQEYDVVGRIFLPSGTVLTIGDVLLAVPLLSPLLVQSVAVQVEQQEQHQTYPAHYRPCHNTF